MLEKCNFIKESCRRVVGIELQTTFICSSKGSESHDLDIQVYTLKLSSVI